MQTIDSLQKLEETYSGPVSERARWKEIDHVNHLYRQFIEAAPFLVLSTHGENGVDCSPRGDPPGFVRVVSPKCIQIPDRRGNNRIDSMRNLLANGEVGLIFLIPGVGETLRVSGKAEILVDAALCASFAIDGKAASSVISVSVERVFYQCQKALLRSRLWDPEARVERGQLPSAGQLAQFFSAARGREFDGEAYDANYDEHLKQTIY
jgi:PPOX class probable FMN-dependent enzyme